MRKQNRIFGLHAMTVALSLLLATATIGRAETGTNDTPSSEPLRVLILSGLNNHDWRSTTPELQRLFEESERFGTVDITDDPGSLDAAAFARYDVIFNNYTPYPDTARTWSEETENAFLAFIRDGGGFVTLHAGCCSFQVWPEFQKLVALTWKANHSAHGAYHAFHVEMTDEQHPITRDMPDFWQKDELYHNMVQIVEQDLNVLARAFSAKERGGTDKFEPMAVWTRMGEGRCINTVLGHDAAALQNTALRCLLLRSAEWAATGEVTIPIPDDWPDSVPAADVSGVNPIEALDAVTTFRNGQNRDTLAVVEQLVRTEQARSALGCPFAEGIAQRARSTDATLDARRFLCRQLALIGAPAQVPALAQLLAEPELFDAALYALDRIPGKEADAVLRQALDESDSASQAVLANALGRRRDALAVPQIRALATSDDTLLAQAAIRALGDIGSPEAENVLRTTREKTPPEMQNDVADALLACAEARLTSGDAAGAGKIYAELSDPEIPARTQAAALRGLVATHPKRGLPRAVEALRGNDRALGTMALRLVREAASPSATILFSDSLSSLSPPVQRQVIIALAARGDAKAVPAIREMTRAPDDAVRLAAIRALGALGGVDDVATLVALLDNANEADSKASQAALESLCGAGVDDAIVANARTAGGPAQTALVRALDARGATDAIGLLMELTTGGNVDVREEAWKAIRHTGSPEHFGKLAGLLTHAQDAERREAEKAVVAVGRRWLASSDQSAQNPTDTVLGMIDQGVDLPLHCSLLRVLGGIADNKALQRLQADARGADAEIREAALRALADWPTPEPMADLLELARELPESSLRVLVLRGFAQLLGKTTDIEPAEAAQQIANALPLADANTRKTLLDELTKRPCVEGLDLATQSLTDPSMAEDAGRAITVIAGELAASHPKETEEALRKLLELSNDAQTRLAAETVLVGAVSLPNLALAATPSSPDGLDSDGASSGDAGAIDGDPATYWDEANHQALYCYRLTFAQPTEFSAIKILAHHHPSHVPKQMDIVCDGKVLRSLQDLTWVRGRELLVKIPRAAYTYVELRMAGEETLISPALHEVEIYNLDAPSPVGGE